MSVSRSIISLLFLFSPTMYVLWHVGGNLQNSLLKKVGGIILALLFLFRPSLHSWSMSLDILGGELSVS